MSEPQFCVCDRRKGLRCAFHSRHDSLRRRMTPEDRWTRPMSGSDMFALFIVWCSVFAVVLTYLWQYGRYLPGW